MYQYKPVQASTYRYVLECACMSWYVRICTGMYLHILMCWYELVCTGLYWYVLAYTDVLV